MPCRRGGRVSDPRCAQRLKTRRAANGAGSVPPRSETPQGALEERSVDARVVCGDEMGARDERGDGVCVNPAPAHVLVGESCQRGDDGIERVAGVVEMDLGLVVEDLADAPVADRIGEGHYREFDGLARSTLRRVVSQST